MTLTITAPVGAKGKNRAWDVQVVQYLLNQVPPAAGGPDPSLDIDGLIGPKTQGAISSFQRSQFGWADGLIEPGKVTIQALNNFDPGVPPGRRIRCGNDRSHGYFWKTASSGRGQGLLLAVGLGGPIGTPTTGGGSDPSPVQQAKTRVMKAKEWLRKAFDTIDKVTALRGTAGLAGSLEFQAMRNHFHLTVDDLNDNERFNYSVTVIRRRVGQILIAVDNANQFYVDSPAVGRYSDAHAYVLGSVPDEKFDQKIHFTPNYLKCGPLTQTNILIHEGAHWIDPSFMRDQKDPRNDLRGYIQAEGGLPLSTMIVNAYSYGQFVMHVGDGQPFPAGKVLSDSD
jgi:hypothetical protein